MHRVDLQSLQAQALWTVLIINSCVALVSCKGLALLHTKGHICTYDGIFTSHFDVKTIYVTEETHNQSPIYTAKS